jgi:hypothetical protein
MGVADDGQAPDEQVAPEMPIERTTGAGLAGGAAICRLLGYEPT